MQTRGTSLVLDYVQSKKNVISGQGATRTLNELESGSLCLFDRAAGIVYTLPTAKPGMVFEFLVTTTITSNNAKIITGNGEFLIGNIGNLASDVAYATTTFAGNGTSHVAVTQNGTTTGGVKGTNLVFRCLTTGIWIVTGSTFGTGTLATPFTIS